MTLQRFMYHLSIAPFIALVLNEMFVSRSHYVTYPIIIVSALVTIYLILALVRTAKREKPKLKHYASFASAAVLVILQMLICLKIDITWYLVAYMVLLIVAFIWQFYIDKKGDKTQKSTAYMTRILIYYHVACALLMSSLTDFIG